MPAVGGSRRRLDARAAAALAGACLALASGTASAQGGSDPATGPGAPGTGALERRRPQQLTPVQITGSRPDDVQERRNSTAAKIVIGRDEIDNFGDSTSATSSSACPA